MTASALPSRYRSSAAPNAGGGALPATIRRTDESSRRVLSGALAVFVIIAVARVHTVLGGIGEALPFAKLAVLLLVIAAWQAFGRDDVRQLFRTPTAKAFAAIVVLAVLSVPLSVWQGNSVAVLVGPFLPVIVLFALGSLGVAGDRRTLHTCMKALCIGVGVGALVVLSGRNSMAGRAMLGGGLDPNDTAALMVATIPLALTLASERGILRRVLFTAIALLSVGALVKTGSRGGVLGLIAMALSLVVVARGRQRLNYLAIIVVGSLVFGAAAQEQLRERFASTFQPDYNQTDEDGRIQIWKRGIGYMVDNPVLGVGFANFTTAEGMLSDKATDPLRRRGVKYTTAHNSFIQIGAELGVGGLLAFVAMIVTALHACWRVARSPDGVYDPFLTRWARAGVVSLFGLTVSAFFLSLAYTPMLMVVVMLCTSVMMSAGRFRAAAAAGPHPEAGLVAAAPVGSGWRSQRSLARVATRPSLRAPHRARAWRSARGG